MPSRVLLIVLALTMLTSGCRRAPTAPKISLVDAVVLRDSASIQAHLDAGTDVNAADGTGMTPLVAAASSGQVQIVQLLLDAGAKLNVAGPDGGSALIYAIQSEQPDVAILLVHQPDIDLAVRESDGNTALVAAVAAREQKVIQALLDQKADINAPGPLGRTALHVAAMQQDPTLIQYLLDHGADVHAVDDSGASVLHNVPIFPFARDEDGADNTEATLKLFLKSGCDINAADKGGQTPLHIAVLYSHPWIIKALLDAGADPLHMSQQGFSPVCYVALPDQASPRTPAQMLEILALFREAGLTDESIIDVHDNSLKTLEDWVNRQK